MPPCTQKASITQFRLAAPKGCSNLFPTLSLHCHITNSFCMGRSLHCVTQCQAEERKLVHYGCCQW